MYDTAGTNPDGTTGESCDPFGNAATPASPVDGCDPNTCRPLVNWACDDVSLIGTATYNCTCDNPAGTYAVPTQNSCAQTPCVYIERCLAGGRGCIPGAGGNACDRCLTAADVAQLGPGTTTLNKAGYYKAGQICAVCPATSAVQIFAAAAAVVALAVFGFKASQVMGSQATNNMKKIVESLQFFSLSLGMSIEWPGPVLNLGKYLEAFTFSIEFLRPECVATGLNWFNIFIASVFVVPVSVCLIVVVNDRRSRTRYENTVRAVHSETKEKEVNAADDGNVETPNTSTVTYWIERPGYLWGTRRTFQSEGGDKIVNELQRQYRYRANLRTFGVLAMTVLYLPIVRMCMQSYDCIKLDGVDGTRLEHDIDIKCESAAHETTQATASIMLVLVGVGMPLYVMYQVRKIRVAGKLDDPRTLDAYGAFYDIYRRDELSRSDKLEIARVTRAGDGVVATRDDDDEMEIDALMVEVDDDDGEAGAKNRDDVPEEDVERAETPSSAPRDGGVSPRKLLRSFSSFARSKSMGTTTTTTTTTHSGVANDATPTIARSPSAKARRRAMKMRWRDQFALYYLAVELALKSSVILVTSPHVSQTALSGWALVFVHWFNGAFVVACQPWRVMTLGFGKWRVTNCLNKVEALAGFLQGFAPCLAMAFPVRRDAFGEVRRSVAYDVVTAVLTAIITVLLAIRVFVFVGERVAVRRKKMDIERDPEASVANVRDEFVSLAKSGAVVRLYALKADFDIKRRKTRARLEDTRAAMLTRVEDLKASEEFTADANTRAATAERIVALYEVANEMARVVNVLLPHPDPEGADAERRAADAETYLDELVAEVRARFDATGGDDANKTARAEHVALLAHAHDTALARLDADMRAYADAESLASLVTLGRAFRDIKARQLSLARGFGDDSTREALARAVDARDVVEALRLAVETDDAALAGRALESTHDALRAHESWCRDQAAFFNRLAAASRALDAKDVEDEDETTTKKTTTNATKQKTASAFSRAMTLGRRASRKRAADADADADVDASWPASIPRDPRVTTDGVCDVAVASLRSNEALVDAFAVKCAETWAPTFAKFGRLRYARAFGELTRRQLAVDVGGVTSAEEARGVYDDVVALSETHASRCVADVETFARLASDAAFAARYGAVVAAATRSLDAVRADAEAHGARARGAQEALGRLVEAKNAAREARAHRQRACDEFTRATRDADEARIQSLDDARLSRARALEDAKKRRDAAVIALDAETDAAAAKMFDAVNREADANDADDETARRETRRRRALVERDVKALRRDAKRRRDEIERHLRDALRDATAQEKRDAADAANARSKAQKEVRAAERDAAQTLPEDVHARRVEVDAVKAVRRQQKDVARVARAENLLATHTRGELERSAKRADKIASDRAATDGDAETTR